MGWNPLTGFLNINKVLTIPLVLGAELKCSCGSKHSFLLLEKADFDINCLPKACVDDSKAFINIRPFGICSDGSSCKECMELEEEWENPKPQNEYVNGKEIITTKSFLLCSAKGGMIEAETSGQEHGKSFIEALMLFAEMEENYEGLFDLLLDPYGSLYLEDGMYEKAIQFLADYLEERGGEVFLPGIYDMKDPKDMLVVAVLDRLLTDCDCSSYERLINGLENIGVQLGMDQVEGWDVRKLNEDMIKMLQTDCMATAEKINTSSFARWTEEHKKFVSIMGNTVLNVAYAAMIWSCTTASSATKAAGNTPPKGYKLSGQWENVNESMSDFSRAYQKQVTGVEGKAWVQNGVKFDGMKDGVLLDAKGKYSQFINKNTGEFYDWFSGKQSLVDEATRQINASEGAKIQWHFAEEESLNVVQDLFIDEGITEIEFIFDPPK